MEHDLSYFEANPEQFEALSDSDRAMLANGYSVEVGEPAEQAGQADAVEETSGAEQPEAPEAPPPVLLARDGKHTIPYDELVSAREQARQYEQLCRDQAAMIEALKTAPAAPQEPAAEESPAETLKDLKLQFAEATILDEDGGKRAEEVWAKIEALQDGKTRSLITQEFEARDAQSRAQQAQELLDATVTKAIEVYPFLDSTKPTANQAAIADITRWRDSLVAEGKPMHVALAEAVQKFGPMYAPPPAASAAAQAEAAIASAKSKPPASMSSIPSSATPPADELQALSGMSVQSMQDKLMGMPPDKIMELLNKTILV
jgi:hypothetical protein